MTVNAAALRSPASIKRVNAEKEKLGEIARTYDVSRLTISRWTN